MGEAIGYIREQLREMYPEREIEGFIRIIFRNLLHYDTVDILLHKGSVLPDFIVEKLRKVLVELQKKRPIQYIFGNAYFHGHTFCVDESTLIPRPETEELVDMIVDENPQSDLAVLDAGTGSGCIAISLALALKFSVVDAIDISENALAVARKNAETLKANVSFKCMDMLNLRQEAGAYDIVVSNPPYITESEKGNMDRNVLDYEPSEALFVPDNDPLRFYRALAGFGKDALRPGGKLYFEINSRFPEEIAQLLLECGYEEVAVRRDMQGLPRFATARKEK